MTKQTFDEALQEERFGTKVAMECGPIIEKIAFEFFPDKTPEELGQLLLHNHTVENLIAGYYLHRDIDELGKLALPDKTKGE